MPLTPGVIYVSHLPQVLFETQIKSYFEQFGKIRRMRLSRSKKVKINQYLNDPSLSRLRLKMSSDITLVWGQISEPKVSVHIAYHLLTCWQRDKTHAPTKPWEKIKKESIEAASWFPKLLFQRKLMFWWFIKLKCEFDHFWFATFCRQTGNSKGYAFIEFDCDEVAKIVAEAMNNYLMGERLIKCKCIFYMIKSDFS